MKILSTILKYIETIVNIFSNALVQTFLVYTTVVLIYKFFIEEQTTNYIPTFVTTILDKIRKTFYELNYITDTYGISNKDEIELKYQQAKAEESIIHKQNKEHNRIVINNALKLSLGILATFVLFTLITRHMSVNIHWYQLLLSAAITVVGTSYEYFFITQIIVKYNFIELTNLYDAMAFKLEKISTSIIDKQLVGKLEEIVKNHEKKIMNNAINKSGIDKSGIDNIASATGVVQNIVNITDNIDTVNNVVNEMENGLINELEKTASDQVNKQYDNINQGVNINTNINGNGNAYGIINNNRAYTMDNVQNLIDKVGNTLNDIDHNNIKMNI
jgi:hypothetical protein